MAWPVPSKPYDVKWPESRVWRPSRGKALLPRLVSGRTSVLYRFGSPFSSKVVVCGHCLVTLSITFHSEIFSKMTLIAAHLNTAGTMIILSGGDSVAIGISIISLFPRLHTPFPASYSYSTRDLGLLVTSGMVLSQVTVMHSSPLSSSPSL